MTHPFRFGVLVEAGHTREALSETARRAEGDGWSTLLIRDHFVEAPFGHQFAPFTALAWIAGVTTTLRLGTLVLDHDYRHPVILAKEAATLDVLSGGRFELGLGAGWARTEYKQAGIPFDPAGTRVDRFQETLAIVRGLFAGEPFTFDGRHFTIGGLEAFPKPAQRPHLPILVGAGGRRMLSIAAREADIIGLLSAPIVDGVLTDDPSTRRPGAVAEKVGWIRAAAGARIDEIELSTTCSIVIDEDRATAAERLRAGRGWRGVSVEEVLEMPTIFIGGVDRIAEQMRERRERYGISYFVVSDRSLGAAGPVVSRLAGQ
jgi:probable F420-dependent oxidoreductase